MSTWLAALIGAGISFVVMALGYVVWRWGTKKAQVVGTILGVLSGVLSVVKTFFKDNPGKFDAYDAMDIGASLAKTLSLVLEKGQASGASFESVKADMIAEVNAVVDKFEGLHAVLTHELVEKEVTAILTFIGYIPKVNDVIKK